MVFKDSISSYMVFLFFQLWVMFLRVFVHDVRIFHFEEFALFFPKEHEAHNKNYFNIKKEQNRTKHFTLISAKNPKKTSYLGFPGLFRGSSSSVASREVSSWTRSMLPWRAKATSSWGRAGLRNTNCPQKNVLHRFFP